MSAKTNLKSLKFESLAMDRSSNIEDRCGFEIQGDALMLNKNDSDGSAENLRCSFGSDELNDRFYKIEEKK